MPERQKDVMVFHYDPKRKFYLVTLQLKNVPGALGNLTNLLGVRGVNILEGFFAPFANGDYGTFSFFVESTKTRMDKDWLREFLESCIYVSEVAVKEGVEGFLTDSLNFPVVWNTGDRAIVMRVGNLQVMLDTIREAGGAFVVYEGGFQSGKSTWENLFSTFRPKTKEGLSEVLQIYSAVGWGRVELLDLSMNKKSAKIRMTDGFECTGLTSKECCSHYIRGHLAGAMSAFFGIDLKGVETKCLAKGDKYCEFELSP
jgi:predicted hydrocarbon binding protein